MYTSLASSFVSLHTPQSRLCGDPGISSALGRVLQLGAGRGLFGRTSSLFLLVRPADERRARFGLGPSRMAGDTKLRLVALPAPFGAVLIDKRHGALQPRNTELFGVGIVEALVVALHTEVGVLAGRRCLGVVAAATDLEGVRV